MARAHRIPSPADVPAQELARRRAAVAQAARERGLAGVLAFSRGGTAADHYGDVLYLTGHHSPFPAVPDAPTWAGRGHAAVVVPASGPSVLVTDYVEDPGAPLPVEEVRVAPALPQAIGETLRELGLAQAPLGLVGRETLPLAWMQQIEQAAGQRLETTFVDEILERLRLVKSDVELAAMRAAAEIGAAWMTATLEGLQEGRTEGEAVGDGLRLLAANGGQMYDVAIAGGPRAGRYFGSAGLPHWDCERRLQRGDLVHVDTWGTVGGYYTDLARSTVVGRRASDGQRELLEASVALVEHVIDGARPGTTVGALCRRGDAWRTQHGFADDPEQPTHGFYGHGLGLGTERPWIMPEDPTPLAPGMVFAIETIVSRPGVGAANFEQTLIVTDGAPELITTGCPTRWWE